MPTIKRTPPFVVHPESRLEFETLISDTSAALIASPPEEIEPVVERALERVRMFFDADRCGLLSASADHQVVNVRFASFAEGIAPIAKDVNLAPIFEWSAQRLFVDRLPVRISRMADLPLEADVERETWIQMSIRSVLNIPIETNGVVRHTIVLNSSNHECEWPDAFVTRLRLLGEMLVSALERKAMFIRLQEAEERVSLAADAAEAGFWALDYGTDVFWVSDRCRKIFGYSPDEVITIERFEASVCHADLVQVHHVIERSGHQREPFEIEYRILWGDGSVRWIVSRGRTRFTSTGEPRQLTGVSIDITERKLDEEELRASEARLESGVDLAGLAFYEVDFSAGSMHIDDRMRRLCGIPPDREDGLQPLQFWMELLHPDDLHRVLDARNQMQDGRIDRISVEYRYMHPAQGPKWMHHLASVAARDSDRRAVRTYGVLRDVTEQREAEEALRKSYAEIERLKNRLQAEGEYLKAELNLVHAHGEVIGKSAGIRKVLRSVEQVASTHSSVLVRGETGTGKELVAQAIHRLSHRAKQVMVKVNCAALPSGLVESELFGREKGAFTGALTRQIGRFEVADGSTIFLDEIGELSLDLQSKLLRVLEAGEFERLGSPRTIKVNVRLIAATNRNLDEAIRQGRFREDLYYRLNVFPILVPPLRDRAEDIPLLVWAFLEEFSSRMGKKITQVSRKTMEILQRHTWPGNVRELRNVIEHGAIITIGDTLRIPSLGEAAPLASARQTLAEAEREHILRALERASGHIKGPKGAAAELGLNPATLYSRMKKLGIRPRRQKENGPV